MCALIRSYVVSYLDSKNVSSFLHPKFQVYKYFVYESFSYSTVKFLNLRLEEQSDLGLHCLPIPICPKTLDHYGISFCH